MNGPFRHLPGASRSELNSGGPVSMSGRAVLNATRLALLISLALGPSASAAWRLIAEHLEGHGGGGSVQQRRVEWSPWQIVNDLLDPVA